MQRGQPAWPQTCPRCGGESPRAGREQARRSQLQQTEAGHPGGAAEKRSEQPPRTEVRDVLTAVQRGSGGVRGPASGEERTGSGRWGVQAGVPPGRAGSKEEGVCVH